MTVLFLGPDTSPLLHWLQQQEVTVIHTAEPITPEYVTAHSVRIIVSYGYRHRIKTEVLDAVSRRAVNLHISYLPWNRGADPNFWSFITDTPKGVTIHYIDEGIDTGDIVAQRLVRVAESDTLATSYQKLHHEIIALFKSQWALIKSGKCERTKQPSGGTSHRSVDKEPFSHLLADGWDTPVSVLIDYAADVQVSEQFWDKYYSEIAAMRSSEQ